MMKFYQRKFMDLKFLVPLAIGVFLFNCKQQKLDLRTIEAKRIDIDKNLESDESIEAFIAPYRSHIEKDLDSVLAYAVDTYSKTDGERNTAIGNLMADIIMNEANTIFKMRTGNSIDAVILNYGGIRSIIPKGSVTTRTAYNVMPFENKIVVVGLKKDNIDDAINYLIRSSKAHPIAGLNMIIDKNRNLISAKIKGKEIDTDKIYYVATSDYLYNRGDNMKFFQPNESLHDLDYKIRNILIDYFKKVDTINPVIDNRFIIK